MANMALDFPHSSSPVSFRSSAREPYSYAAEHALSEREPSLEELEAAVKETPPRPSSTLINGHFRNSSEPRSLDDVMDEGDKMLPPGSPSLRHTKGRLENERPKSPNESFANVVKHEPAGGEKRLSSLSSSILDLGKDQHAPDSTTKADTSVKQKLLDAQAKDTGANASPEHASVKRESSSQSTLNFPDTPKNDPVKREHAQSSGLSHLPKSANVKQEETPQKFNLPDLPEHDPSAPSDSYTEAVKHEPTSPVIRPDSPTLQTNDIANGSSDEKAKTAAASSTHDLAETSPQQAAVHDTKSLTHQHEGDANKPGSRDSHDSTYGSQHTTQNESAEDGKPGSLIYENYESRSGTNLASIALGKEYELAMSQRDNKQIQPKQSDKSRSTEESSSGSTLVSGRRAGAGWSRSAVRWAPLNVPLQRRLQTLAVLAHSLSIASFVAFFFFLCAIPVFWPIIVPYLIYVLLSSAGSDGRLAHRSEYLRRSKLWSLFASYFPARLHRSVELEPTRKYIFGYHPHGIISHGAFAAFATDALGFSSLFPGITNTLLTLDSNFRIPLYRDWVLRLGLASVARESCENLLSRGGPNGQGMGRAITIVIGGARESLDAKPGTLNLVLAKRKGFVKLAVRTGADLVPVLAFGENDIYDQISAETHPWIHQWQLLVKRFMGFTLPLFHARGIFNYDVGIMPYRRPINIVVGRPIQTRISEKPDPAYVDELHKQYTDELLHLWNEWKDTFAPNRKAELQIAE